MQSGILHAVSIKKPHSRVCGYGRIQQSANANRVITKIYLPPHPMSYVGTST